MYMNIFKQGYQLYKKKIKIAYYKQTELTIGLFYQKKNVNKISKKKYGRNLHLIAVI